MFAWLLISVFAIAHIAAEIPPYIHVCDYKDPQINQCILENINNLKSKICEGIPELDIPPINSWRVDKVVVVDTPETKIYLINSDVTGLCDFDIKYLSFDIDRNHFDVELVFKKIKMNSTYDFDIRIVVPIKNTGEVYLNTENIKATVNMDMKVVSNRGKRYMFMSKIKINLHIKDYNAMYNLEDTELSRLQMIIDNLIGNNKEEVIKVFKPAIEKAVSQIILSVSNNVVKHFPYEEIFPGRP